MLLDRNRVLVVQCNEICRSSSTRVEIIYRPVFLVPETRQVELVRSDQKGNSICRRDWPTKGSILGQARRRYLGPEWKSAYLSNKYVDDESSPVIAPLFQAWLCCGIAVSAIVCTCLIENIRYCRTGRVGRQTEDAEGARTTI